MWCSNSFPSFLNEDCCHLSFSAATCSRDQQDGKDTVLAITLGKGTPSKLYNLTPCHMYDMDNIVFNSNNTDTVGSKPGTPLVFLPCVINSFATRSWEKSE
eukprot:9802126-Ditylum_brightwellii.AAC.1